MLLVKGDSYIELAWKFLVKKTVFDAYGGGYMIPCLCQAHRLIHHKEWILMFANFNQSTKFGLGDYRHNVYYDKLIKHY